MISIINKTLNEIESNLIYLKDPDFQGKITNSAKIIISAIKNKKKIIFMGNGGSAADAEHLSAELLGKYLKNRKAYPAISITSNTSSLTAISNDFGYENSFARQIQGLAIKGDVVVGISTSMQSKNINKAILEAKKIGCKIIILASKKAKKTLAKKSDVFLDCPGSRVDRIQENHICVGHMICEIVENKLS